MEWKAVPAGFVCLLLAFAWSGCRKEPESPNHAPVMTPGFINAPVVETRHGKDLPAATEFWTIPSGSQIQIRNNEAISLQSAEAGETFPGVVARDVRDSSGRVAIPRGSGATLIAMGAAGARVLDIGGVEIAGKRYGVEAKKQGNAGAKSATIPASTVLSFRLDGPARMRQIN